MHAETSSAMRDGLKFAAWAFVIIILAIVLFKLFLGTLVVAYFEYWAPRLDGVGYNNFGWGLVHGTFVTVNFWASLFSENLAIYQPHDNGNFYDWGFIIGATGGTLTLIRAPFYAFGQFARPRGL